MRLANWRSKEIFKRIENRAYDNANAVMDTVVQEAKTKLSSYGRLTNIYRPPGWSKAHVSFTPRSGRNKDKLVSFNTDKRWTGRDPGTLSSTIRRVNKDSDVGGTIRVYAGNFKIYYARYVEHGTASTGYGGPAPAKPFMRPSFQKIKKTIVKRIKDGGVL